MKKSVTYFNEVLKQMPRLLGLMNRSPLSKTYGCFDRQYWQYNVIDTPSARCQEAVLTLALLYEIKSTPYYKNKLIIEWINAGIDFWIKIQEKNGSFNEWYPYENSFVATAFSCYAVSETLLLLKDKIRNKDSIIMALIKACDWLSSKKEKKAQNQEAGAIIALYNLFLLTGKTEYKDCAIKKAKNIVDSQTKEGWFYEYGGPDIGYLSLAIDYLAKYYKKSKDEHIFKTLNRSIDFISYFIHPNLTFGGEYGSRNTEYLIPSGFEILAKENAKAAAIAKCIRDSIKNRATIAPFSLDDRYLTYITYNWLQAYLYSDVLKPAKNKFEENLSKNFILAQIYILSNPDIYLIVSYGKGGAFKLFFKKTKKAIYDGGILVETNKGLMSGFLTNNNCYKISNNKIRIEGFMSEIMVKFLTPKSMVASRLFQMGIGKNEKISKLVKEKLRDKLVTIKKLSNIKFIREIFLKDLKVMDIVMGNNIKNLIIGSKQSYAYTPSSRYFQLSELDNESFFIRNPKKSKKIIIKRIFEKKRVKYEMKKI